VSLDFKSNPKEAYADGFIIHQLNVARPVLRIATMQESCHVFGRGDHLSDVNPTIAQLCCSKGKSLKPSYSSCNEDQAPHDSLATPRVQCQMVHWIHSLESSSKSFSPENLKASGLAPDQWCHRRPECSR